MGIVNEMERITQEIISSYESRVSAVGMIIDETHQLLDDFKNRRSELSEQIRENLAREESLRKKDFDNMMRDVLSRQDEREREMRELLWTFLEEQKEMAETIKKNLSENKMKISDFRETLKNIQTKQEAREKEVSGLLKDFQQEYKNMVDSLCGLLEKGDTIKIKDFKEMLKDIRAKQMECQREIITMLDYGSAQRRKLVITIDK